MPAHISDIAPLKPSNEPHQSALPPKLATISAGRYSRAAHSGPSKRQKASCESATLVGSTSSLRIVDWSTTSVVRQPAKARKGVLETRPSCRSLTRFASAWEPPSATVLRTMAMRRRMRGSRASTSAPTTAASVAGVRASSDDAMADRRARRALAELG